MITAIVDNDCPIHPEAKEIIPHIVKAESNANPFAIGVVGGHLVRQPKSIEEAIATANSLEDTGRNYSVGLAQINRSNFKSYGITSIDQAFESCRNLTVAADILLGCYKRANSDWPKALSCYYSGNFVTGFEHGYVRRVIAEMPMGLRMRMLTSNRGHRQSFASSKGTDQRNPSDHKIEDADAMESIDGDSKQAARNGVPARDASENAPTQLIDDATIDQMMRHSNELMKRIKKHASATQAASPETTGTAPLSTDLKMQGESDGAFVF